MVEIRSFAELLADLRRLGSSFRSLIAYTGDDSIKHWNRLRDSGNLILDGIWYKSIFSSPKRAFHSIDRFNDADLTAFASGYGGNHLFKRLVGFEFEPRYRSFEIHWPTHHIERHMCFSSGAVFQPVIPVDPELAGDLGRLWPLHRFELLDRCANGCEMIAEIVEREMAADNQADEDGVIDSVARSMVWGNDKFNDIPPRGIKVLSLLLDAYRDGNRVVTLGEIEVLEVSVDGGMIDQVFRVKGKRHTVSKIIDNLRGGRYRLKPPGKNT